RVDEVLGEDEDLFVVAGGADEDPTVVDEFADVDHRAHRWEGSGADDDEAFGQEHIGTGPQPGRFDLGCKGHAHAPTADDHVRGHALVIDGDQGAPVVRRLRQAPGLLLASAQFLSGRAQGLRQGLIALTGAVELLTQGSGVLAEAFHLGRGLCHRSSFGPLLCVLGLSVSAMSRCVPGGRSPAPVSLVPVSSSPVRNRFPASRITRRSFFPCAVRVPMASSVTSVCVQAAPSSGAAFAACGRFFSSNGATPSAMRRAMMRNPVWAIIRWSGRTASPSTCQPRIMASMDSGSAKFCEARRASTKRESCGTVAT